jgi:DNA-directed RNA polymerase subunit K/omega
MSLKKSELTNLVASVETKDLDAIARKTGNLYQSLVVISKRANQINAQVKEELHNKLQEFASHNDNLEEVFENREQIEISKYYERLPNPCVIASSEFMKDEVFFRKIEEERAN